MIQLIPRARQKTTKWSGGETSELFIYPPQASLTAQDFLFRISTASVACGASDFTGLYFPFGSAHVTAGDSSYSIEKNDFLLISNPAEGMIIHVDTLCEQYLIMTGVELDDK